MKREYVKVTEQDGSSFHFNLIKTVHTDKREASVPKIGSFSEFTQSSP